MVKIKGHRLTVDQAIRQFFGCDHKEIAKLLPEEKAALAKEAAKELGCELAVATEEVVTAQS